MEMTTSPTPPPPQAKKTICMTICLCHGGICELSIRCSWPGNNKYLPAKHSQSHFCYFSQCGHCYCDPPTPAPDHAPCTSAMTNQIPFLPFFCGTL